MATRLDVDPAKGLSAGQAADLAKKCGPNALPAEKATPEWRRFLDEYRSYLQIILVVAGIVSFVIQEWSTGVLLVILTIVNAVVGMREEGKAQSAMNALKSMMKASARVRRDGAESAIPADQLVPGDVVLLAAGDQVPADGRLVGSAALQIDESALTGESVPSSKGTAMLPAGIMLKKPRPRNATILTRGVIGTAAGVGIFMAAWLIFLINHGSGQPGGAIEGATLALTAFAFFRIVCTFESRSELGSSLHVGSFDNRTLNIIVLVEVVLAYLVTSMDALQKLLGTTDLTIGELGIAFGAGLSLLVAWEVGKAVVRRTAKVPAA